MGDSKSKTIKVKGKDVPVATAAQTTAARGTSGYMVASGDSEGSMACMVDGVAHEGNYVGNEGDPCTVSDES